jgi:hypothetical protein
MSGAAWLGRPGSRAGFGHRVQRLAPGTACNGI